MSSESMPVLSRAIIYLEMFMTELEKLGDEHKILKPWTEVALRWAKKYYTRMDDTDVYVVCMCNVLIFICYFTANLNLQFSIHQYASRGSKTNGTKIICRALRG